MSFFRLCWGRKMLWEFSFFLPDWSDWKLLLLYFLVLFVLLSSLVHVLCGLAFLFSTVFFHQWILFIYQKKLLWIGVVCVKKVVDQLITCFNSRITLKNVLFFFGICWVMRKRKEDLLACWKGCFGRHQREYVWTGIPLCIVWTIWRECDSCTFKGVQWAMPKLKMIFLRPMYDWMAAECSHSFPNLLEFCDLCNFRWLLWCISCISPVYLCCALV